MKIKKNDVCEGINYCIVIPFKDKIDFSQAIDKIKETRKSIQISEEKRWYCDGMIIDKKDYERLLKKSKAIEILNELEE